jgi:hypothetical protein
MHLVDDVGGFLRRYLHAVDRAINCLNGRVNGSLGVVRSL